MSPERIYEALTVGSMRQQTKDLNFADQQMREIAEYLGGRKLGAGNATSASVMPNRCVSKRPLGDLHSGQGWNGCGFDLSNTRFEPANVAKLSPGQVSRLKLVWAFGLSNASDLYNHPTLVGGRIFYLNLRSGGLVALDLMTGVEKWYMSFTPPQEEKQAFGPRGASSAVTVTPGAVLSGDLDGMLRAFSPDTGVRYGEAVRQHCQRSWGQRRLDRFGRSDRC